jgi:hypothetical protein
MITTGDIPARFQTATATRLNQVPEAARWMVYERAIRDTEADYRCLIHGALWERICAGWNGDPLVAYIDSLRVACTLDMRVDRMFRAWPSLCAYWRKRYEIERDLGTGRDRVRAERHARARAALLRK